MNHLADNALSERIMTLSAPTACMGAHIEAHMGDMGCTYGSTLDSLSLFSNSGVRNGCESHSQGGWAGVNFFVICNMFCMSRISLKFLNLCKDKSCETNLGLNFSGSKTLG